SSTSSMRGRTARSTWQSASGWCGRPAATSSPKLRSAGAVVEPIIHRAQQEDQGWTMSPSHFQGPDLAEVWLGEEGPPPITVLAQAAASLPLGPNADLASGRLPQLRWEALRSPRACGCNRGPAFGGRDDEFLLPSPFSLAGSDRCDAWAGEPCNGARLCNEAAASGRGAVGWSAHGQPLPPITPAKAAG